MSRSCLLLPLSPVTAIRGLLIIHDLFTSYLGLPWSQVDSMCWKFEHFWATIPSQRIRHIYTCWWTAIFVFCVPVAKGIDESMKKAGTFIVGFDVSTLSVHRFKRSSLYINEYIYWKTKTSTPRYSSIHQTPYIRYLRIWISGTRYYDSYNLSTSYTGMYVQFDAIHFPLFVFVFLSIPYTVFALYITSPSLLVTQTRGH